MWAPFGYPQVTHVELIGQLMTCLKGKIFLFKQNGYQRGPIFVMSYDQTLEEQGCSPKEKGLFRGLLARGIHKPVGPTKTCLISASFVIGPSLSTGQRHQG